MSAHEPLQVSATGAWCAKYQFADGEGDTRSPDHPITLRQAQGERP